MQILTLVILISVTLGQYLASLHILPGQFKYLPEVLTLVVALCVAVLGAPQRFRAVAPRYWLAFSATAVVLVFGVLATGVEPGPLMQGARFYLRAIPLFFLPAVFVYSESQLRTQLRLLLAIALLQVPISIYQRYVVYSLGHNSGDPVFGTLMISSIMSIFLIGAICMAAAFTLRRRMSRLLFFLLFVLFVIPTTINETKATIFLLPIGLLGTLIAGSAPATRVRTALSAVALIAVFGALFVPIYNFFSQTNTRYPYTIEEFFTNKKFVVHYVDKNAGVDTRGEVGRVDSLVVPLQYFSSDPVRLMLGVGIGNSSGSSISGSTSYGTYYSLLGRYTECTSASAFIVEIGVVGFALVMLLYWLVFRDALWVSAAGTNLMGCIALGWVGITLVIVVATFYKSIHAFDSLSYLYWYFAGLIAAARTRSLSLAASRQYP
jgi:hypothetical protein